MIVFIDHSADDDEVFHAKSRAIERLAAGVRGGGERLEGPLPPEQVVALDARFRKLADWPCASTSSSITPVAA